MQMVSPYGTPATQSPAPDHRAVRRYTRNSRALSRPQQERDSSPVRNNPPTGMSPSLGKNLQRETRGSHSRSNGSIHINTEVFRKSKIQHSDNDNKPDVQLYRLPQNNNRGQHCLVWYHCRTRRRTLNNCYYRNFRVNFTRVRCVLYVNIGLPCRLKRSTG